MSSSVFNNPPWMDAYQRLLAAYDDGDDGESFHVLHHPGSEDSRPLLIWVHPGDAIEDADSFDPVDPDSEDGEDLYRNSLQCQGGMAQEVMDRMATHQVVVLHRYSSQWAFDFQKATPDYERAMLKAEEQPGTVILFGDDLEAAGSWLVQKMNTTKREVFLTGAYSDPRLGCVAAIGKAIEAAGCSSIQMSSWSPSEPGSRSGAWKPQDAAAPSEPPLPGIARRPPGP